MDHDRLKDLLARAAAAVRSHAIAIDSHLYKVGYGDQEDATYALADELDEALVDLDAGPRA